jgi:predicted GNAT superfamily acetyltransferase
MKNFRPEVDLRPLGDDDLGAVLALNQHWVPHVGTLDEQRLGSLLAEATLALGAWSSSGEPTAPGVADRREQRPGELSGFVIILADGADYSSPNYRYFSQRHDTFTYVDRIAVSPSAQGLGVGRRLYDAVVAHARSSGSPLVCAEVNLEPPNPESQAFHSNYGFVEVGRQWTYGDTVEVQLLELTL